MPTTHIKSVKPGGGGDFTSLSAWEAATQGDLVASDTIEIAELYAGTDTTAVTVDGWTTGPNNYIEIRSAPVDRHVGKFDATKQVFGPPAAGNALVVVEDYVRVLWLQVLGVSNAGVVFIQSGTAENTFAVVDSVIIKTPLLGAASNFLLLGAGRLGMVSNCVGFNTGVTQGRGFGGANSLPIINCVSSNSAIGMRGGVFVNCIAVGCTAATNLLLSATNCIGNSADILAAPGSGNKQGIPLFVNAAAGDFHLQSSDTVATNFGLNETVFFTNDIDGQTRPATGPWDAGADQINFPPPALTRFVYSPKTEYRIERQIAIALGANVACCAMPPLQAIPILDSVPNFLLLDSGDSILLNDGGGIIIN